MRMIEQFRAARRAKAPLVAIRTPDPASTTREITQMMGATPVAQWNIISGLVAVNDGARESVAKANQGQTPENATSNPVDALRGALLHMPRLAVVYFHNAHMYLEQGASDAHKPVIQAVWNMRDDFKSTQRTLVLLCPEITIPMELKNDVLVIDEALPNDRELASLVTKAMIDSGLRRPGKKTMPKLVRAVSGLAAFNAEQVIGMSIKPGKRSVDLEAAWHNKIQIIEQERGLKVFRTGPSFDDIGGNQSVKELLQMSARGKRKPTLIVFIDEIEKALHAAGTDTSGTTTDQLKVLLTDINDNDWDLMLLYGFPGTGKSELCKAFAQEAGCITVQADLGSMKHIWVGSSEARMRAFMKTVKAMGQGRVFFVTTCNQVHMLKHEFIRRCKWLVFCDFPDRAAKDRIWEIHMKNYHIAKQKLPSDDGWTGSDIRACNRNADEFGIPLLEASKFVTPVYYAMGDQVEQMRMAASGKYLDADKPGKYLYKPEPKGFMESYGFSKKKGKS